MTSSVLAVLMLLTATGFAAGAADPGSSSVRSGLSPLAEKYARRREALLQQYAAKRRSLIAAPEWKEASPAAQRAALDALAAAAKAADDGVIADYDAELRRGRAAANADAVQFERQRQDRLDELRVRAAQDALRARPPR